MCGDFFQKAINAPLRVIGLKSDPRRSVEAPPDTTALDTATLDVKKRREEADRRLRRGRTAITSEESTLG